MAARRHAATVARTGRCGSDSRPSSLAGRCAAPAAAGSSFQARRGIWDIREIGRATTEQSTRSAIEARLERRGNSVGCPMARIRRGAKNVGETRGRGSLSRWPVLGALPAGRGSAAVGRLSSSLLPASLSFHCRQLQERPESGEIGWGPTANVDAPAPLSSLLLLGLHGYRRNDSSTTGGGVASKSRARRATHMHPGAHFDMGNPHG